MPTATALARLPRTAPVNKHGERLEPDRTDAHLRGDRDDDDGRCDQRCGRDLVGARDEHWRPEWGTQCPPVIQRPMPRTISSDVADERGGGGTVVCRPGGWARTAPAPFRISTRRIRKSVEMILKRRRERIQPVRHAHEKLERLRHRHIFDAKGNNSQPAVHGPFDFTLDLRRVVRLRRVHHHHHTAGADGIDDRAAPVHTRKDVPRSDPATDPPAFKGGTDGVRRGLVVGGVADEHVVGHGLQLGRPYSSDAQMITPSGAD